MDGNAASVTKSPIYAYLAELHARVAQIQQGAVATYIPELATANPDWFGICIATTDGHVYEIGDSREPFTIQSVSKPLVYGLALEDQGREAILRSIGVEPTGDAFNSISLAPDTGRPLNPMINAGAITATSLVAGRSEADKFERIRAVASLYAGRPLTIDDDVYASEKKTGHRNRAIGHMLRNFGILKEDPEHALDLYFRQCAIRTDCRDLSIIAATLANGGLNPRTGERAVDVNVIPDILSVMTTCGMYDYSGEWVYRVGMPAKSGVAGGILAVLPGQLGIGVFSPRLDARGNSVRGVRVCEELSHDFKLHFLDPPQTGMSVIRSTYSLATMRSKRRRTSSDLKVLDECGSEIRVFELQGDLRLSTVEVLVREVIRSASAIGRAIVDLHRVSNIDAAAVDVLVGLVATFRLQGKEVLFSRAQRHARFRRRLEEAVSGDAHARRSAFAELDLALEWCENYLLMKAQVAYDSRAIGSLAEHDLCAGLAAEDVDFLARLVTLERYADGAMIMRQGEVAGKLYFLMRGEVSVIVERPNGQRKRLATILPGMGFGESALVHGGHRSADVQADSAVECYTLTREVFEAMDATHASLKIGLMHNLLRFATTIANRMIAELSALEG